MGVNNEIVGTVNDLGDIPKEYIERKAVKLFVERPKEIDSWRAILSKYMTESEIDEVYARFVGMNLNGAFVDFKENQLNRVPARLNSKVLIPSIDVGRLQRVVSILKINLG